MRRCTSDRFPRGTVAPECRLPATSPWASRSPEFVAGTRASTCCTTAPPTDVGITRAWDVMDDRGRSGHTPPPAQEVFLTRASSTARSRVAIQTAHDNMRATRGGGLQRLKLPLRTESDSGRRRRARQDLLPGCRTIAFFSAFHVVGNDLRLVNMTAYPTRRFTTCRPRSCPGGAGVFLTVVSQWAAIPSYPTRNRYGPWGDGNV